jgi:hypothetical protein
VNTRLIKDKRIEGKFKSVTQYVFWSIIYTLNVQLPIFLKCMLPLSAMEPSLWGRVVVCSTRGPSGHVLIGK